MSDAIETINGTSLAVFHRDPAWHRLGTVMTDAPTIEQAMSIAHLSGWNVRHAPLTAITESGVVEVEGKVATVRDNPIIDGKCDVLGVTSPTYGIVQNEAAFAFAQNILDTSGTTVEAAGSLNDGKRVWMLLHLPTDITLSGGDVIRPYLLVTTSHDGTSPLIVQATTIRVVCANTLAMSLRGEHPTYKVRHTSGATGRVEDARNALDLGFANADQFAADAERWMKKISVAKFTALLDAVTPMPSEKDITAGKVSKASATRIEVTRDTIQSLYVADPYKGTAWGALNAFTEYADHAHRPKRTAEQRALTAVNGWGDRFKDLTIDAAREVFAIA